jgi:hypothetical protein
MRDRIFSGAKLQANFGTGKGLSWPVGSDGLLFGFEHLSVFAPTRSSYHSWLPHRCDSELPGEHLKVGPTERLRFGKIPLRAAAAATSRAKHPLSPLEWPTLSRVSSAGGVAPSAVRRSLFRTSNPNLASKISGGS